MTKIKGNVANLIPKIVIGVIVLVLVVGGVFVYFTQFRSAERAIACGLGIQNCDEFIQNPPPKTANMVSAIRCAYYRCELGCDNPLLATINIDVKNKADSNTLTLNCKTDLCVPYADPKTKKACNPKKGAFAIDFQRSPFDVGLFKEKEFGGLDVESQCKETGKITLKEADIALKEGTDDKLECERKRSGLDPARVFDNPYVRCELNGGIYKISSGTKINYRTLDSDTGVVSSYGEPATSACSIPSLEDPDILSIKTFSLSVEPKSVPVGGEFALYFAGYPADARSLKIVFNGKDREKTYDLNQNQFVTELSKRFKVGVDIDPLLGYNKLQLKALGKSGNVVGISETVEITII